MSSPTISVIVPVYNVEPYLEQCLDSIARQSFADFEAIIVNDGSTDASGLIANEFAAKDSRFTVLNQENRGLSAARNTGIEAAQGTYLCFVDSDDICHLQMLEVLLSAMQRSKAKVAFGKCYKGEKLDMRRFPDIDNPHEVGYTIIDEQGFWRGLFGDPSFPYINAWCKLFDREMFSETRFAEGVLYEDHEIAHRLFHACDRIALANATLYFYRARPSSITYTPRPGHYLDLCEPLIERQHYLHARGWTEFERDNAAFLISRLTRTYPGIDTLGADARLHFDKCRDETWRICRGLLPSCWKNKRFLSRVLAFRLGMRPYLAMTRASAAIANRRARKSASRRTSDGNAG